MIYRVQLYDYYSKEGSVQQDYRSVDTHLSSRGGEWFKLMLVVIKFRTVS